MLSQKQINDIVDHAAVSDLARHNWSGRGRAPIGYVKGMAVTYGLCLQKLAARDSAALAMVRVVEDGHDVFDHYEDQIRAADMISIHSNPDLVDIDRLRLLFVILCGLGMRESSGRYCEGRDRSASNTSAETAEAGLFQQSWDSRRASPEITKLFHAFTTGGMGEIFKEGVTPRAGDMDTSGTGDGATFQIMCKTAPGFAVQVAAIGLRTICTHWGPIVRREAELVPAADALFRQVQMIVGANAPVVVQRPAASWLSVLVGTLLAWFRRAPTKPPGPPVPPHPASIEPPWMRWAAKEVGFHETGTNRNIGRYTGPAKCGSEGDPWCAIFVNAALESNNVRGTRSAMARSFERDDNFVRLDGPAYGAITTMWRGSPGSGLGHVFFYAGHLDNTRVLALGGNQSDQVCRQAEPVNRVVGYWWPKSVPLPKIGKVIVEDDGHEEGSET